jgi:hypothetical protein
MKILSIDRHGSIRWYRDYKLNRDLDFPSAIWTSGHREWYKNGKLHRENGPAVIYEDSETEYWLNDNRKYTHPSKAL